MPNQPQRLDRYRYCCGFLPIFYGIYAIVFHCFIHGVYGVCVILTSYHRPRNDVINYTAVSGYFVLTIIGAPVWWVILLQKSQFIKIFAIFLILLTAFNLTTTLMYAVEYFFFKANSLLDRVFLWRYGTRWVTDDQFPFAIWHLLTGLMLILTPLWFYYAYILFAYTKYLSYLDYQLERVAEIVILDNRMGPYGYRPQVGYPYSTNVPPPQQENPVAEQNPPHNGQYVPIPRSSPPSNPKSILD